MFPRQAASLVICHRCMEYMPRHSSPLCEPDTSVILNFLNEECGAKPSMYFVRTALRQVIGTSSLTPPTVFGTLDQLVYWENYTYGLRGM